jgi:histidinol-phosphate aminotransferase
MVLEGAGQAYTSPTKVLVNGSPSYVRHSMRTEVDASHGWASPALKAAVKLVPVTKDLKLDLDGMAAAAKGAGMVFICNPNNPTSTAYSAKEIGDFIAKVKATSPGTAIQIDEAYIDYVDMPTIPTAAPYALEHPDVMITRTFSKAYGMAGLRLGYAFGQPATLKKVDLAWGAGDVNLLTAAAGIAGINDKAHMDAERKENKRVRDYTIGAFKEMGYEAPASHTNFLFVNVRRNAKAFRDACAKEKVFVGKSFPPLDKTHARITIGTWDEMHKAMEVFKRVLQEPTSTSAE